MLNRNMLDINGFINDEIFEDMVLQELNFNHARATVIIKFTFNEANPQSVFSFIMTFDRKRRFINTVTVDLRGTVQDLQRYEIVGPNAKQARYELSDVIRYYFNVERINYQTGKIRIAKNILSM